MFQPKATTAKLASEIYTKLQKRNPDLWAENLVEAVKDLEHSEEIMFFKFLADPTGRTNLKNMKVETVPMRSGCVFDNTEIYEQTEVRPGVVPCICINYLPSFKTASDDDEKSNGKK